MICAFRVSVLLIFFVVGYTRAALTRASGVGYIGRGYDIVDGNPAGVPLGGTPPSSATDPGMKSFSWLELTYDEENTDAEEHYLVPDQLSFQSENSCMNVTASSIITNNKQFQDKLKSTISLSAKSRFGFGRVAFSGSMSTGTETAKSIRSKKVYYEESVLCSFGNAAYRFGNERRFLHLTSDAVRSVCRLPLFMTNQYYEFISYAGTHFIHEATLGTKIVHRKETVMSNFFESVLETSGVNSGVSASFMGKGGSLGVDVNSESLSKNSENMFGQESLTWTVGSRRHQNPTYMKLEPISELLDKNRGFWTDVCDAQVNKYGECCRNLDTIKSIMDKALETYAFEYRRVEPPSSAPLIFDLVWPEGTYALHSVNNRCPRGHDFTWARGTVFQDTDDWTDDNKWRTGIHWAKYQLDTTSIVQSFCVKGVNNANDYELKWPRGDYCINKFMRCPDGFKEGFITFDDENVYNKNWRKGSVPDGVFEEDTTLYYCCRNDGSPLQPIRLPSTDEFYLVRQGSECQTIHNMNVQTDWVEWSLESWWGMDESEMIGGEMTPYVVIRDEKLRMFFCHYKPVKVLEKETITINIQ